MRLISKKKWLKLLIIFQFMKVINLDQLKYIIIDQMLSAYYISFIIIIMSYLDLWDCFNEVRDH